MWLLRKPVKSLIGNTTLKPIEKIASLSAPSEAIQSLKEAGADIFGFDASQATRAYGAGDAAERSIPRHVDALSCAVHGSRRYVFLKGMGQGGIGFAAGVLHLAGTAAYLLGTIMKIIAGENVAGKSAAAGAAVHVFSYFHWLLRAIFRLIEATKGDSEIIDVRHLMPDKHRHLDMGSAMYTLRLVGLSTELIAAIIMLIAAAYW